LRAASGFGAYEESLFADDASEYGGDVEGRTVGFASLGELTIGGTIAPGLVLGGGAYTAQLLSAHFKLARDSDGAPPSELDPELRTLALFGPFLQWYPNARRGFHVEAALGFAAITSDSGGSRGFEEPDYQAIGAGLVLGSGYEWFIADEWSIGVLGRMMAAVVTGEDDAEVRWVHGISTTPSLLLSITYH